MSERNDIIGPDDEEIMERIESLLSTPLVEQEGAGASGASGSFYDFCAQLAATVPQADDKFRSELLARLLHTRPEKNQAAADATPVSATGQVSQNSRATGRRSLGEREWHPGRVLANLFNNKRLVAQSPERAHQRSGGWGRAASFALGLAGTAAILVMLVVMAATLKIRYDKSQGNKTPVAAAVTPAESLKILPGIVPIYTLDTSGVQYMVWSPDGRVLATGYGNNVELWDGASGQLLRRIDVDNVSGLWWSPNSATLVVGVLNTIRLFDVSKGRELTPVPSDRNGDIRENAAWSPDGRTIASGSSPPFTGTLPFPDGDLGSSPRATALPGVLDGIVNLWDPVTGNTVRILKMPPLQDAVRNMISKLAWSSDGRYVAALYGDSSMGVWDANDGAVKLDLPRTIDRRLTDVPRGFEWSSKGHTLARLAGDIVELWDPDTGKRVGFMPYPSPPPVQPPTPIPTKVDPLRTLAPAERRMPIAVPTTAEGFTITPAPTVPYLSPTPSPTYVYEGQGYRLVGGLAWSPDGRTLATFDESNIRLWDPATGKQKKRMAGDNAIRKLAWSPDGGVLFSLEGNPSNSHPSFFMPANEYTFLNGDLKMWDPLSGKQLRSVSQDDLSDFLLASGGRVLAVRVGTAVTIWSVNSKIATSTDNFTATALPSPAVVSTGTSSISQLATTPLLPHASTTAEPVCGSWSVVPASIPAASESELRSVSALSPRYAWIVGYYSATARDQNTDQVRGAKTLIMRWDGKQWAQVRSPDAGTGDNFLNGVAALAENDAWAVGYFSATDDLQQALILHWDGAQWSQASVPAFASGIGNGNSKLNAVSGSAPDDVWAVGTLGVKQTSGGQFTLILHWDGKSWSRVPSPSPGIEMNELTSVSAVSKNVAWTAGQYMQRFKAIGAAQGDPLVLRWDGKDWKPVPNQFDGTFINSIDTMPVGPSQRAWIVGGYMGEGGGAASASRWSGTRWENVALPQLGNVDSTGYSDVLASSLNGVVTLSPDDAWTVGSYSKGTNIGDWNEYTLTEHWDGTVWSQVPSPNVNLEKPAAVLNTVDAISSTDLWAVGRYGSSQVPKALILHYSGSWCASPTPHAEGTMMPASTTAPDESVQGSRIPK